MPKFNKHSMIQEGKKAKAENAGRRAMKQDEVERARQSADDFFNTKEPIPTMNERRKSDA